MGDVTHIGCICGQVRLAVAGSPIASVECCCRSCRDADARIRSLEAAPTVLTMHGTTPFVMYRKDRVRFLAGDARLKSFRLSPDSATRRVVATCCHTPVYLMFKGGHWLSLYGQLWPAGTMPPPEMRTMASDLPTGATLPNDIPNARKHSPRFLPKLFGAWVAMGFRNPTTPQRGKIDVPQ